MKAFSPATRFHWIWIEVKPRHQTHPRELFQETSFCNKKKKSLNPKYKRKNKYTSSTGRTLSKCSEHTTPDPDLKTLYGRQKEALACIYCSTATISTGFNFKQQFVEWVAQPPWSICSCSADHVGSLDCLCVFCAIDAALISRAKRILKFTAVQCASLNSVENIQWRLSGNRAVEDKLCWYLSRDILKKSHYLLYSYLAVLLYFKYINIHFNQLHSSLLQVFKRAWKTS